ncbi:MAG: hypothetical protein MJ113_07330 [Lachnospiraceae bacterium]|nr:hypothetical protein [Lachnospiraceae bacterium]
MEENKTYSDNSKNEKINKAFERLIGRTKVTTELKEGKKSTIPAINKTKKTSSSERGI